MLIVQDFQVVSNFNKTSGGNESPLEDLYVLEIHELRYLVLRKLRNAIENVGRLAKKVEYYGIIWLPSAMLKKLNSAGCTRLIGTFLVFLISKIEYDWIWHES